MNDNVDLDYEDLSYISSISEYLMQKDTSIKLFNIIYDLFIKMDKVNYHYNKNDDEKKKIFYFYFLLLIFLLLNYCISMFAYAFQQVQ